MSNVKHSSDTNEWYTPAYIIEMVREVMGSIDLDPASCPLAQETVKAKEAIYEDSLNKTWVGSNVYLNPPGGKIGNKSQAVAFWEKLIRSRFDQAIFMGFSLEILATSQQSGVQPAGEFMLCVPSKRIKFISPTGEKSAPSHANVIIYIPRNRDESLRFINVFEKIGTILNKKVKK